MKQNQIKSLVLLALFIALEYILWAVPSVGLIRIFTIEITLLHIPVIIASLVLGYKEGMILGFIFGLLSFITASTTPLPHAFLFSPLAVGGNFASLIIVFVPRITIGFLPRYFKEKFKFPIALSALCTSIIHTVLVIGLITLFFRNEYQTVFSLTDTLFIQAIGTIIFINGIVEAIAASIITTPIVLALNKVK